MVREWNVLAENVGESGVAVLALEGSSAVKHFVNKDTQRPPVDSTRVAATLNNLWSYVFFGADKRVGSEVRDA